MKLATKRIIGITLILAAMLGAIISLTGMIGLWRVQGRLAEDFQENVRLIETTLDTTSAGLEVAKDSIDSASESVAALEATLDTLAKTIEDSSPMMDSLAILMGEDLPATIVSTQLSLDAAQSSAVIIEGVLKSVTAIPFFPGEPYDPPVPLNRALAQVSDSLENLPVTFMSMEGSLNTASDNMAVAKVEVELISKNIIDINDSLNNAAKVIEQYQQLVDILQSRIDRTREAIPGLVYTLVWASTGLLIWMLLTQIGLFIQGLEMFQD